jgi:hypothetical protein
VNEQLQPARRAGDHLSGRIALDNLKSVAPAPNEERFAADHLSVRLAFLLLDFRPLDERSQTVPNSSK